MTALVLYQFSNSSEADRMALYKIGGDLDNHVRNVVQTWDQWLEGGENVVFVSSEGTRIQISRHIAVFYSSMLGSILAEIPVGIEAVISFPFSSGLINNLVDILTKGEVAIANKQDLAKIKTAGAIVGISLEDLNIEIDKDISNVSTAAVNIKKEVFDDELFPEFSGRRKTQPKINNRLSATKTKTSPLPSPKVVPKSKRTSIRKSALNVPTERLLAEDDHLVKASANIKKEVDEI